MTSLEGWGSAIELRPHDGAGTVAGSRPPVAYRLTPVIQQSPPRQAAARYRALAHPEKQTRGRNGTRPCLPEPAPQVRCPTVGHMSVSA
jgi:hypothetical protein